MKNAGESHSLSKNTFSVLNKWQVDILNLDPTTHPLKRPEVQQHLHLPFHQFGFSSQSAANHRPTASSSSRTVRHRKSIDSKSSRALAWSSSKKRLQGLFSSEIP